MTTWLDGWLATRYPGIWTKDNLTRVRIRVTCRKTGKRKEANRVFTDLDLRDALLRQAEMRQALLSNSSQDPRARFGDYALDLFERKKLLGQIKSAKSKERWRHTLMHHLVPAFGDYFLDAITLRDIETWKAQQARKVTLGRYSPNTVNGWIAVLRVVLNAASAEYQLQRNPVVMVKDLDTSEWRTYTEEEPNSLTVDELRVFLRELERHFPRHYAFAYLGFVTGQRPSHLRPLRRRGPERDVLWESGVLLIRRSETRGHVMNRTKTARDQRIALPREVMRVLEDHVVMMERRRYSAEARSDLLFPSETGGYRSASSLDHPMRHAAKAAGIRKHLTPRAMRRTFQDLMRASAIEGVVARSISGHATAAMQDHYSTVGIQEQRDALARAVSLMIGERSGVGRD